MRIASLSPATTEILYALGEGKSIVCVDQFSNMPDDATRIPHLMGHQKMKAEDLQKFAPEIVFTETVIQEKLAENLRAANFTVVHQDPRTLNQIDESIRAIGVILSREKEAQELSLKMRQGLNDVKAKSRLLPRKPRVYVEEWHKPPMASGNWVPEIVRIAGGQPFPIADGQLSREVTLAEVQQFDPDFIVISWCGAGLLAEKELLLERTGWGTLRAVQAGHVQVIDDALLNRPGPRLVEGAQRLYGWMFQLLH